MKIISEKKLTEEEIERYESKGYEVHYGYENLELKDFYPGESVGFILDTMYKSTIELIETLLWSNSPRSYINKYGKKVNVKPSNHHITLKYNDLTYQLDRLEEWRYTHQSDKDQIKTQTENHPLYKIYLSNRKEYFDKQAKAKAEAQYEIVIKEYDGPTGDELDNFIITFARLYDIKIDLANDSTATKIQTYKQLKWYLDNDIEYAREIPCINYKDEPMFAHIKFLPTEEDSYEAIEETLVGDPELLEDTAYKTTLGEYNIDSILQTLV